MGRLQALSKYNCKVRTNRFNSFSSPSSQLPLSDSHLNARGSGGVSYYNYGRSPGIKNPSPIVNGEPSTKVYQLPQLMWQPLRPRPHCEEWRTCDLGCCQVWCRQRLRSWLFRCGGRLLLLEGSFPLRVLPPSRFVGFAWSWGRCQHWEERGQYWEKSGQHWEER